MSCESPSRSAQQVECACGKLVELSLLQLPDQDAKQTKQTKQTTKSITQAIRFVYAFTFAQKLWQLV